MSPMAMKVSMNGFLGLPDDWKPTAGDIAAEMRLDFESSVFSRMKELGLKKKDLAKKANVSPAAISKALSGGSNLTIKTIAKIAAALDCTVSHLSLEDRKPISDYFSDSGASKPSIVTLSALAQRYPNPDCKFIYAGSEEQSAKVSESSTANIAVSNFEDKVDAA